MKGRRRFSPREARRIRKLLAQKATASPSAQKAIRAKLRAIGFYISDFDQSGKGFTVSGFDRRVASGEITIGMTWWQRFTRWLKRGTHRQ